MIHEDHVARLFAAEVVRVGPHLARDRGVADLGANQPDAGVAQRQLESEVAHHGCDHGVAVEPAFGRKLAPEQRHHVVAVEDFAALVDQHHAIAVAVERDADVAVLAQNGFANRVEMHRAAIQIDIDAVGIDADRDDLGAEFLERLGTDLVGRAVGAIDRDFEAVEGDRARQARFQKYQVAAERVVDSRRLADIVGARAMLADLALRRRPALRSAARSRRRA